MILHYLKSSFRYMRRIAGYSIINISGLILGITASAFLFIYVWDELRHDRFHKNGHTIYRILTEQQDGTKGVTTPGPLGEMLQEKYSQLTNITRIGKWSGTFKVKDQLYDESEVYFVDNAFFQMFDFKIVQGDAFTALKRPNDIVLTEKIAAKFFGNEWKDRNDVIGSVITMNGETDFTIVGIAENPPSFSSIQFDYLLSFEMMKGDRWNYQWGSHNFHTYVQLKEDTDPGAFESAIRESLRGTQFNEGFALKLQPLYNIYLESFPSYDWGRHGNRQYIISFALIGVLILMIACFNYVNLATSQAVRRAREIGIRKINGAGRVNVFFQFMGESALMVVLAALIGRALVDLLLPAFNDLSGKTLVMDTFQIEISLLFIGLAFFTTCLAGIYPAITLANLKSLSMIRQSVRPASKGLMRNVLVAAQFTVSLILICLTIVIFGQLNYMREKSLGYNNEGVVNIKLAGSLKQNNEAFKQDLLKLNYVQGTARSTTTLVNTDNGSYIDWPGKTPGTEITITQMNVDSDFLATMDIKLVAGREFTPTDSNAYILNEAAAKAMGLTDYDAVGMKVKFWGTEGEIIGIAKDFHFRPMHHSISPLIIRHNLKENFYQMLVKVDASKIAELQQDASALYKRYEQNFPFSYGILDDSIEKEYRIEHRVGKVATVFSTLAIIISLLGVIGLVSHAIHERSKEFTIRRVLGLRLQHLLLLLSRKLFVSYLLAMLIATPIFYLLVTKWLQNFSYAAPVNPVSLGLAYLIVILLVVFIIVVQALQQMRKRTVDSLRSE